MSALSPNQSGAACSFPPKRSADSLRFGVIIYRVVVVNLLADASPLGLLGTTQGGLIFRRFLARFGAAFREELLHRLIGQKIDTPARIESCTDPANKCEHSTLFTSIFSTSIHEGVGCVTKLDSLQPTVTRGPGGRAVVQRTEIITEPTALFDLVCLALFPFYGMEISYILSKSILVNIL